MSNLHDRRRSRKLSSRRSREPLNWLLVAIALLANFSVGYCFGYFVLPGIVSL
jgi:hypothetical protein